MIAGGIELDIKPSTLEEWDKLSPKPIRDLIESLFKDRKDFRFVIPIGYTKDPESPSLGVPIPAKLHLLLQILDRVRFQETLTLVDSCLLLKKEGMSISTQALQYQLDRIESNLELLKPLSPGIQKQVKDKRDELVFRRKRRVNARKLSKSRELKAKKKQIEDELNRSSIQRINDAKKFKLTAEELQGESLNNTIDRLKEEAQDSRFSSEGIVTEEHSILFEPTPKQADFLAAPEKVVFYGGAAGGGKSYALIFDAVRYAHRPAMRALILRRRNSELKELISVTKAVYPKAFPGAKFNKQDMVWTFPSGATLEFGYFDKPDDKERYVGLPYSYIAWDELQLQKSPEGFDFLFSRLRTTDPEITTYIRCTGNPGGAPWIKQRFIDPAPYGVPFKRVIDGDRDNSVTFKFIPATLFDNPYLTADGEYEKILRQMSKTKVQQLLYGNWDVMEDSFFNFDQTLHITSELPPRHWPIIQAMDYGWNDPACSLWARVDPISGAIHVYKELEMIKAVVERWASQMRQEEQEEQYCKVADRVIDHTLFKMTGHTGPSHLETLRKFGFSPRSADRQREAGWEQVNQRLMGETPALFIHESCDKLIDQLLTATPKESQPDDIDQSRMYSNGRKHHWDLLDCLRYMCMSRPRLQSQDSLLNLNKASKSWDQYNNYFT